MNWLTRRRRTTDDGLTALWGRILAAAAAAAAVVSCPLSFCCCYFRVSLYLLVEECINCVYSAEGKDKQCLQPAAVEREEKGGNRGEEEEEEESFPPRKLGVGVIISKVSSSLPSSVPPIYLRLLGSREKGHQQLYVRSWRQACRHQPDEFEKRKFSLFFQKRHMLLIVFTTPCKKIISFFQLIAYAISSSLQKPQKIHSELPGFLEDIQMIFSECKYGPHFNLVGK